MSEVFFKEYFDSIYSAKNNLSPSGFEAAALDYAEICRGILPEDRNAPILDIGCGCGHFLYFLKQKGYTQYEGIDISPQQLEQCYRLVTDRAVLSDAVDFLSPRKGVYDFILAFDVVEHIPKSRLAEFISGAHQALKPGGVLMFRVPNMANPMAAYPRYSDMTHEIGFTEKSARQLVYVGGFRDVSLRGELLFRKKGIKTFLRKWLVRLYYAQVRFLYYIQDYQVPEVLDPGLIVIARKTKG